MKHEAPKENFHAVLLSKIKSFSHGAYAATRSFPKDEIFGMVSQLRRASLSVGLNYTEGFARRKDKVHRNFIEIAYGSLKECLYLIEFALEEGIGNKTALDNLLVQGNEIGRMLWGMLRQMPK